MEGGGEFSKFPYWTKGEEGSKMSKISTWFMDDPVVVFAGKGATCTIILHILMIQKPVVRKFC